MKEIKAIVDAYQGLDLMDQKASLATVVRVEGSSYRRTGARMLVLDNGTYLGGISGGCLEGDALRRAQKAIAANKPSLVTYDTTQEDGQQIGVGLGCNGIIDVLFTPVDSQSFDNPVKILSGLTSTRIPRVVVTVTGCPESLNTLGKAWPFENETQFSEVFPLREITGQLLADIEQAMKNRRSKTLLYPAGAGEVSVFIEVILPAIHLVLYAANYDMYPMIRMARELGWEVTAVTNPAKADKSIFSYASRVLHPKGEEQPAVDSYTAILLMTHDYKTDLGNLQKALRTGADYIGLLGPRKRGQKMADELEAAGKPLTEAEKKRIFSPAGLDIGANTPEEIALSILAEITTYFSGRDGMSLRLRDKTIHEI
jgi:xanthine/CO dehydrogenase XdhC/CoxF family maturation factor